VTFQQSRGGKVSARAWGLLFAAVVVLVGALILAFAGREMLLAMLTHNAVDITVPVLSISRWGSYLFIVLAAALTVWFAMEVAFSAETTDPRPSAIMFDTEEEI
jgi:TRAP-type C4-dicarboxylate transport system permease small subunit